jgi:hypothetical protein
MCVAWSAEVKVGYTATMTGLVERPHLLRLDIELDIYVKDIVKVMLYEDLRDMIFVAHNYGGMVIIVRGHADRSWPSEWPALPAVAGPPSRMGLQTMMIAFEKAPVYRT